MAKHAPIAATRNENNPYKDHVSLRMILPQAVAIPQDFSLYTAFIRLHSRRDKALRRLGWR
jgi:hypothetical protein